jgi:hypothetical protein
MPQYLLSVFQEEGAATERRHLERELAGLGS